VRNETTEPGRNASNIMGEMSIPDGDFQMMILRMGLSFVNLIKIRVLLLRRVTDVG
jgi:hypothetical protein